MLYTVLFLNERGVPINWVNNLPTREAARHQLRQWIDDTRLRPGDTFKVIEGDTDAD